MRGLDILISVGDKPLCAQASCQLMRQTRTADISNKIDLDWDDFAVGSKSWSVSCSGAYVVNDEAMVELENAYINGLPVDVKFSKENVIMFSGQAIITAFPLTATFNNDITYALTLQGKGELTRV